MYNAILIDFDTDGFLDWWVNKVKGPNLTHNQFNNVLEKAQGIATHEEPRILQ